MKRHTSTMKTLVGAGLLAGTMLILTSQSGGASGRKSFDYDRVGAIQRFLDAIYPGLSTQKGLLTFRTDEFNSYSGTVRVDLLPCYPGSGIAGGGQRSNVPNCSGLYESGKSAFLHFEVTSGFSDFPIRHFVARGEFVSKERDLMWQKVKSHPEWGDEEILPLLKETPAPFGPENREAFLKIIPSSTVYKWSGCRLNTSETKFIARDLAWLVPGTVRRAKRGYPYPCGAMFEPFEGKLLSIDEL